MPRKEANVMNHPRSLALVLLATLAASALTAGVTCAADLYVPERVTSIAATSNPLSETDLPFRSGLFVAYSEHGEGRIAYFRDVSETLVPGDLSESPASFYFKEPTAIAELDGNLVVWDNAFGWLVHIDLRSGKRRIFEHQTPYLNPSQIALSPEGLVLVLDEGAGLVYWTTLDGGELQTLQFKTQSTSIAFVSWNKLAVLDRDEQSIKVLTLWFDGRDLNIKGVSTLSLQEMQRSRAGEFRSLTAQDGVIYVADGERIFSYVDARGQLVLAVDHDAGLHDISQIQVSTDSFYVIDGEEFRKISRTVPADVVLDVAPQEAQLAMLDLYAYLDSNRILPFREAVAGRDYESLEEFLIEANVFITAASAFPDAQRREGFLIFRSRPIDPLARYATQYERFVEVFCGANPDYCESTRGDVISGPLRSGTVLQVPNLVVQSRLGFRKVDLDGVPVNEYLDALVVSRDQRERINYELLAKRNRGRCGRDEKSCLSQSQGTLSLPYETWTVTTAVVAPHLYVENSPLDSLRDYDGVKLYGLQVETKQMLYSHHLPVVPGYTVTADCAALSASHEQWMDAISYPANYAHFLVSAARIGVIEYYVIKNHQVFELRPEKPTWHEYDSNTFDLVARPDPASLAGGSQAVDAIDVYTRNLHHGTHVSALIGGRRGPCWSGLLPAAQMLHIDASAGPSPVRGAVFDAHTGDVRIINVSQRLDASDAYKDILVDDDDFSEILFVLAAGNESRDLNASDGDSAVRWGDKKNVIVVTALDDSQQVIAPKIVGGQTQPGANWGKKLVDLAAPGSQVLSASSDRKYGPGTGTSQAAPAVTAAAAYLMDMEYGWAKQPGQVKARLIATADWHDGLMDKVWGGMLNLGDAVRFPDKHVVRTHTGGMGNIFEVGPSPRATFTIVNFPADLYDRDRDDGKYGKRRINLRHILSLKSNGDGTHRVVFREHPGNQVRIMLNAQLSGTMDCDAARRWDAQSGQWSDDPLCSTEINVAQIKHYFKPVNYNVNW